MPTGSDLDIIKPVNDVKQYRHCTLNNGLNVLLIHDPRIADAPAESSSDDGDAMSTEVCAGLGCHRRCNFLSYMQHVVSTPP